MLPHKRSPMEATKAKATTAAEQGGVPNAREDSPSSAILR